MKNSVKTFFLLQLIVITVNAQLPTGLDDYQLVFEEDFSNTTVEELSQTWLFTFPWGDDNGNCCESSFYHPDQVTLTGGCLKLSAERLNTYQIDVCIPPENPTGNCVDVPGNPSCNYEWYVSGMIFLNDEIDCPCWASSNIKGFSYGYYEISCKLTDGVGSYPAFWLFGGNQTEIDLLEAPGEESVFHSGVINWTNETTLANTRNKGDPASFHTYGALWTPDEVIFYYDGQPWFTVPSTQIQTSECPVSIIANLAILWNANQLPLPDEEFLIDRISVYKGPIREIDTQETWSVPEYHYRESIGVLSNGILTVNAELHFIAQTKNVVKPGGKMIVENNGIVRSPTVCPSDPNIVPPPFDMSVQRDATSEGELIIKNGGEYVVPAGGKLEVAGSLTLEQGGKIRVKGDLLVNGNFFIDPLADLFVEGDGNITIIVQSGVTISIPSTVVFGEQSKIIVKPGGKLVVDGGTLTAGATWRGIIIEGDATQPQTIDGNGMPVYQGMVELKNGATIENAEVGISTAHEQYISGLDYGTYGGGIIWAEDVTFRNCRKAAEFVYYNQQSYAGFTKDKSHFHNCTFLIDDDLNNDSEPTNMVTMWGTAGIDFVGNIFRNINPNKTDYNTNDIGIYTIDANFTVSGCDDNQVCPPNNPCCDENPNVFDNLYYGILATNAESGRNFTVDGNQFNNCVFAVVSSAVDHAVVTRNEIVMGDLEYFDGSNGGFAILTAIGVGNSTGFRVEENTVSLAANPDEQIITCGTWVENSGDAVNEIYKNEFNEIHYAEVASGQNREIGNPDLKGLQYLCNENYNNSNFDFYIVDDGIAETQGTNVPGLEQSAGNLFSNSCPLPASDFNNISTLTTITYMYDAGGVFEEPICSTGINRIGITDGGHPCKTNFDLTDISCLGCGTGPGDADDTKRLALESHYETYHTIWSQTEALYLSLLDGGSTENLTEEVLSAFPNETWQLRAELLERSPYLSASVLIEVADRTDVLPEPVMFEIMAANPEALLDGGSSTSNQNQNVLQYLLEKEEPMSEAMVEELGDIAKETTTYRTVLEGTLANQGYNWRMAVNYIILDILNSGNDSTPVDYDSYLQWLDTLNTVRSDYDRVDYYISAGNLADAQEILSTIPEEYRLSETESEEYESYLILSGILRNLRSEDRSIFHLDSLEETALRGIADSGIGKAKMKAENILRFVYGDAYNHYPPIPYIPSSPRMKNNKWKNEDQKKLVEFFPNPADDEIQCNYNLESVTGTVTLRISDVQGRIIFSQPMAEKTGSIVLDIRYWIAGLYFCTISDEQSLVASGKFSIIR